MKINKNAKSLNEFGGHARQGDTLLRRIDHIPTNLKRTKKVTLALGENTGHHHTFNSGAVGFADDENALVDFVAVETKEAPLTHQEHDPITYPNGNFESLKQMNYTPEALKPAAD